jgi:hypothetical protein
MALLAGSSVLVVPAAPASALTCTGGLVGNFFNGFYQQGHSEHPYEGASSYIVVRDGTNCGSGHDDFVNAWVMIAGNETLNYDGWGQVGFEHTVGYPLRWFAQNDNGSHITSTHIRNTKWSTFSVASQIGVRHTFRTLWSYACACLRSTIDTTNWLDSPFNPFNSQEANFGPQPWSPQFLEESNWNKSWVPGLVSTPVAYTGLGAQRYSDDVIESMPCILTGESDVSIWKHAATSCTAFTAWTD